MGEARVGTFKCKKTARVNIIADFIISLISLQINCCQNINKVL